MLTKSGRQPIVFICGLGQLLDGLIEVLSLGFLTSGIALSVALWCARCEAGKRKRGTHDEK